LLHKKHNIKGKAVMCLGSDGQIMGWHRRRKKADFLIVLKSMEQEDMFPREKSSDFGLLQK